MNFVHADQVGTYGLCHYNTVSYYSRTVCRLDVFTKIRPYAIVFDSHFYVCTKAASRQYYASLSGKFIRGTIMASTFNARYFPIPANQIGCLHFQNNVDRQRFRFRIIH